MNKTLDLKIGDRISTLELVSKVGNRVEVKVDDKLYILDMIQVEKGAYSILKDEVSYNLELLQKDTSKQYEVHSAHSIFDIEVIDAEAKYLLNRGAGNQDEEDLTISSPMPGKVIEIPVKIGDKIKEGTVVIIIEAMKMQSEYKVKADRTVVNILVKEGEAIDGKQPLIIVE